jgi:hypothetical protein
MANSANIQNEAPFVKSLTPLFAPFASFLFQIIDIHVIAYETFM